MASTKQSPTHATSPLAGRPLLSVDTNSNRPLASPSFKHWSATHDDAYTTSPSVQTTLPPLPVATPATPRTAGTSSRPDSSATSQRIFDKLEEIQGLQRAVAAEHSVLEEIGAGSQWTSWPSNGEGGVGAAAAEGQEEGTAGLGAPGRSRDDKEKSSKSYEAMAGEFAKRQEGIEGIMAKVRVLQATWLLEVRTDLPPIIVQLSTLSTALKEFHALPSPVLFPSNRPSQAPRARAVAKAATSSAIFDNDAQITQLAGSPLRGGGRERKFSS